MTQTITKEEAARLGKAINRFRDAVLEANHGIKRIEAAYRGFVLKPANGEYLPDCATCGKPSGVELLDDDGVTSLGYYCPEHLSAAMAARGFGSSRIKDVKAQVLMQIVDAVGLAVRKMQKAQQPVTLIDPTLSVEASKEEVSAVMQQIEAMRQARRDAGDPDVDLYRRPKGNGHKR